MKLLTSGLILMSLAISNVNAAPMPNSIIVDDKAVVPVLKTQVIRKVEGEQPVRSVDATIFEVTNKGQDIVAREVSLKDNEQQFSEKQMSNPVIQKGGVIGPTSKIEVKKTLKQDGEVISESKVIDASGVEFKKTGEVVKRNLQLEQQKYAEAHEKMSHAVVSENGTVTKDIVIFDEVQ